MEYKEIAALRILFHTKRQIARLQVISNFGEKYTRRAMAGRHARSTENWCCVSSGSRSTHEFSRSVVFLRNLRLLAVHNLHSIVDKNFMHYLLDLMEIWSFIYILYPALFHKFSDLFQTSY